MLNNVAVYSQLIAALLGSSRCHCHCGERASDKQVPVTGEPVRLLEITARPLGARAATCTGACTACGSCWLVMGEEWDTVTHTSGKGGVMRSLC